jgi:two-component system, chemotaxis family, protein-glutamate methylesterase/glutaminase
MRALPPDVEQASEPETTGISCPDCFGVLSVCAEGKHRALHFRCRTGHAYSADEVIAGKELRLEEYVWAAFTLLNELATFLRELEALPGANERRAAYATRAAQADAQQEALRQLLQRLDRTAMPSPCGDMDAATR